MSNTPAPPKIGPLRTAWEDFLRQNNWRELIKGVEPKQSGCGLIYELGNPLQRPNEDFAIVDMRHIPYAEPHYHPDYDVEVYLVLQGSAQVVIAGEQQSAITGDMIVIPPNRAHFTIPDSNYVIAAVNTPPFRAEHYIPLRDSNPAVGFDRAQFQRLTAEARA